MAKTIKVHIKNSYGIIKFNHPFVFSDKSRFYGLYAQNGTMKSSFAKTLLDHSIGNPISDRLFKIPGECTIEGVDSANILAYPSYDGRVVICDEAANLVTNDEAKLAYTEALHAVNEAYVLFIDKIIDVTKTQYGDREDTIEGLYRRFVSKDRVEAITPKAVIILLKSMLTEIETGNEVFCDVPYNLFTSSNFTKFIANKNYAGFYKELSEAYDKFRQTPTYYRNGFDASSASKLLKAINDAKYFKADHVVALTNKDGTLEDPISTSEELANHLKTDLDRIIEEYPSLQAPLNKLIADFAVGTNGDVRKIFEDNSKRELLLFMGQDDRFYKNMWYGYLHACLEDITSLIAVYDEASDKIAEALDAAENCENEWEEVVNIFNDRFNDLPYRIEITNKKDAIVDDLVYPVFEVQYQNPRNPAEPYKERPNDDNQLLGINATLSNGERKALFLLNIIFQLRDRLKRNQEILVVFDDIVESFDYKNKYAFFEYLQEISNENEKLYTIVLTHNFDFFRLVYEKIHPKEPNQFKLITRNRDSSLAVADMFNPRVFGDTKKIAHEDKAAWVAMLPFARNLVEFRAGSGDEIYKKFTKTLHVMSDKLVIGDIKQDIADNTGVTDSPFDDSLDAHDAITETASNIANNENDDFDLNKNITLAIGTRLLIERYIISKISDEDYRSVLGKGSDQTRKLIERYKNNSSDPKKPTLIKIFNKAAMMVDGSIHLNAFMYEPLIDMGTWELKEMYNKVKEKTE